MSEQAQRLLTTLCRATGGAENSGLLGYHAVGAAAGLTATETVAALQELAHGYCIAVGARSEGIWLMEAGARWCRRQANGG